VSPVAVIKKMGYEKTERKVFQDKREVTLKINIRIIVFLLAVLIPGCNATPLPIPPEMDVERFSLTEDPTQENRVIFEGESGAADTQYRYSVRNISAFTEPEQFSPGPDGSFSVSLDGTPAHNYRFQLFRNDNWIHLFDCRSDGADGVIVIEDQDADSDGFDVVHDCNDENPAINPDETEVCDDGFDNDCNGLIDAADPACGCVPEPEICDDGLDNDCDGLIDSADPDCGCVPEPEICGDGIDNDCDGQIDEGCP